MSADLERLISEVGERFSEENERFFSAETRVLFFKMHQESLYCHLAGGSRETWPSGFRLAYQAAEVRQKSQREALKRLFGQLEAAEIPFVPIKGADLAFRIYPDSVPRLFRDWDIWVRDRDLKRFLALLEREGWRCPLDCYEDHHYGMRTKGEFCLEPHFNLPNFGGVPADELWALTEPVSGGKCERRLADDLNLIMLLRHALTGHGQWTDLVKLLLDVEFMLRRGEVKWDRVSELVRRWRFAHPGLLLAAFPEFFRGRHDPGRGFSAEQTAALREFLLHPKDWSGRLGEMKARTGNPLRPAWLKKQLGRLRRDNLRLRHPEIGRSNVKYLACLGGELVRKGGIFVAGRFHSDRSVRMQLKQEKLIESSWRPEPPPGLRGDGPANRMEEK